MNFWKKDTKNNTYQEIFEGLINKKIDINDLDPEKAVHKKAVYNYIKDQPNLLSELKTDKEKAFLNYLILNRDYKLFIYLKPEQYNEDMAKHYLINRLQEDKDTSSAFLRKSFDEDLIFSMYYDTRDGEQIFYYDKEIQTTTFLVSKFDISFKVNSVIKLFKKLDISISMFGYNILYNELMSWINKEYRKTIIKFVTKKDVGVYKINALYDEIEKETTEALNNTLSDSGITVQKMSIQKISISENATKILEKEGLDRIREKIKREAELEYEKQSLENYEKKAKIHKENPNFELTLTEAEKDFALNRYITKNLADRGKLKQEDYEEELKDRKKKTASTTLKKSNDVPHLQEKQEKKHGLLYGAVIFLILAIIIFATNADPIWIGFIYLGISVLFGVFAFLQMYRYKNNNQKITPQMQEEYEARLEEYNDKVNKQ